MDKNQLYDIETDIYKNLDNIKAEQKQYAAGIEKGIDMTVSAVRKALNSEESQPNTNDCIYCHFENDVGAYFPRQRPDRIDEIYIKRNKCDDGVHGYYLTIRGNDTFHACNIKYCPICGRLLESEEEE